MEVERGVHRIAAPLGPRTMYMHVLVGTDGIALVDTGTATTPGDVVLPYLESIGRSCDDVTTAVITHADADHSGGDAALKALRPNASILCHPLDRPLIENPERMLAERYGEFEPDGVAYPAEVIEGFRAMLGGACPVDGGVEEGDVVRIDADTCFEVLHAPGHSDGHIVLFDRERRLAIATDAVLGEGVPDAGGAILFPPTYRRAKAYLETIARLERLRPERLFLTHFPEYRGSEVREFLAASRAFVERLEKAILEELAPVPRTFAELLEAVDARIAVWPAEGRINLMYALAGGLELLEEKGRAVRRDEGGRRAWASA